MRLLEREEPLSELHRLRAEAASDGGRLVFVEGEAGVGKTSLLRAFRGALPDGVRAPMGSCDPLSTPRPLGPLVDIAEDVGADFERLIRDGAPRETVFKSLIAALRHARGELVLLIDDLHWADEATLDALRFIGRRIETTSGLVVGTYRDDEVGRQHPLRVVVGDLASSTAVGRIRLEPLSVGAVGQLATGSMVDPVELYRQTGGNPFYVTEVIAGAPAGIPATVRDAVLARAARLSPEGRATLEAAAVIGPTIEPALLADVVTAPAADECLANGLLQADGRRYAFRHELAREAILTTTDPARRIALNARVLAALEAGLVEHRPSARLAHHADEAGDPAATLRHARAAAFDAIAVGAHRQATAQLARAARYAGGLAPAEHAELLHDLGIEAGAIARYDIATPALEESIRLARRAGDLRREVVAMATLATSHVIAGRNDEGEVLSAKALERAGTLPASPEKAMAIASEAYIRMLDRDNAAAIALGRRAISIGSGVSQARHSVSIAFRSVGAARILMGDLGGQKDLETSARIAGEARLDRHVANAYSVLASALGEVYQFALAEPAFEAGIRYTSDRDLDATRGYLEAWKALSQLYRGRWADAGVLASSVVAKPDNSAITRITALIALGRLRTRRGDPDAWEALDEALEMAERTATLQRVGPVRAARAEAAWLEGNLERAGEEARVHFELARAKAHGWHIGELAWWQVKAGVTPVPDTTGAAEPWRLQLDGRSRQAADAWLALECPYEAARALLESDAIADVQEAHATFDGLGARPAAAMAAARLRELGVRSIPRGPRATTRANPAGLTTRELEVLRLVAAGLPNHRIAAQLFLSTRTVDHHVAAVLGKLGVDGRAAAGPAAARLGIDLQDGHGRAAD